PCTTLFPYTTLFRSIILGSADTSQTGLGFGIIKTLLGDRTIVHAVDLDQTLLQHFRIHVQPYDRVTGIGKVHDNAPAHGAGTDNPYFLDVFERSHDRPSLLLE